MAAPSGSAPPEDPWIYSVDQVIARLAPHIDDNVIAQLRSNDVTGRVLLITSNFETLKSELNIRSLGKRTAIMIIVAEWRARSVGYRNFRDEHLSLSSVGRVRDTGERDEYPLIYSGPTTTTITGSPAAIAENRAPIMALDDLSLLSGGELPYFMGPFPSGSSELRIRPGVAVPPVGPIIGARGDMPEVDADVVMDVSDARDDADKEKSPEKETFSGTKILAAARGDKPEVDSKIVVDNSDSENGADIEISPDKETSVTKKRFLPPKSRKIDTLFYDVEVGEGVDAELNDDEKEFCFTSAGRVRFLGEQRYVADRMRYFLSGSGQSVWTRNNGHLTAAFRYYNNHYQYFRKGVHPSFTVYDVYSPTHYRAHRETSETLLLPWGAQSQSSTSVRHGEAPQDQALSGDGYFDLLLKWQNIDGATDELPVFGESDNEDESDQQPAVEEEGGPQEEIAPLNRSVISLTGEEVEEAVDEVTRELVEEWESKIMPKKEATKAYSLWRRAQKEKRRKRTAHQARIKVEELDQRLLKLRSEFFGDGVVWRTKDQVRKQAHGCMEVTVWEREEKKWLAELMERSEQPAKPKRNPIRTKDGEELSETDDGEDVGNSSDDEFYSADEEDVDLGGFLVSDDERDLRDGVEIEVAGEREVEEELAQRQLDLGFDLDDDDDQEMLDDDEEMQDAGDLPVTARQSIPAEYIDLTQEPSLHRPRREPVVINLLDDDDDDDLDHDNDLDDDREMTRAATPEEPPRDKLYQDLQELTQDQRFSIYWGLCDIGDEATEPWYILLVDCVDDLRRGRKIRGLKEQLAVCPIYAAWALDLPQRPKFPLLTAQQFRKLKKFRTFREFTSAVCNILGQDPKIVDLAAVTRNPQLQSNGGNYGPGSDVGEVFDDAADVDDRASGNNNSPRNRKRKHKEVAEDQGGKDRRGANEQFNKNLVRRIAEQQKRAQKNGVEVGGGKVVINLGHYANDRDILIIDEIASCLKKHQIEGVRFMWQQLVQSGQNRGALLAHTMGLGKTLQVIALLYTLARAGASDDPAVKRQIPAHLQSSRTLILSPPTLIENWWDEFNIWLPIDPSTSQLEERYIGKIYRITSAQNIEERRNLIRIWDAKGGILLIGYSMFRALVAKGGIARKGSTSSATGQDISSEAEIERILLQSPRVIVADEAHQLKGETSQITHAARGFKSMSRIAMTGSPLSNSLVEYWAMIEWIDPGYLGPLAEFNNNYVAPIQNGLYSDSPHCDKRLSLKKLRCLKKHVALKTHRAGIEVIKDFMPQKKEFSITVSLTDVQIEMYNRFLEDTKDCGLLEIITHLPLICGHPEIFAIYAEDPGKRKKNLEIPPDVAARVRDEEMEDFNSQEARKYPWARELVPADNFDIKQGHKIIVLKAILEHSIAEGDRILVFSHSIFCLDFIEKCLRLWGFTYGRLDGNTEMKRRLSMVKKFNAGGFYVFLVSTEAGGLGLNLVGANRVVIFDFKWSPMWEQQAVGRAYRLGQKKNVYVYRLRCGGTYEDSVWSATQFKTNLQTRVVDQKDTVRSASKKRARHFSPPKSVEKEDLTEFKGKDTVLDRIIDSPEAGGSICSIQHSETFQADVDDELTPAEQEEADNMYNEDKRKKAMQRPEPHGSAPGGISSASASTDPGSHPPRAKRAAINRPGAVSNHEICIDQHRFWIVSTTSWDEFKRQVAKEAPSTPPTDGFVYKTKETMGDVYVHSDDTYAGFWRGMDAGKVFIVDGSVLVKKVFRDVPSGLINNGAVPPASGAADGLAASSPSAYGLPTGQPRNGPRAISHSAGNGHFSEVHDVVKRVQRLNMEPTPKPPASTDGSSGGPSSSSRPARRTSYATERDGSNSASTRPQVNDRRHTLPAQTAQSRNKPGRGEGDKGLTSDKETTADAARKLPGVFRGRKTAGGHE